MENTHNKRLSDEEVEREIEALRQSPYVKLAKKDERIRNQRRQMMYMLRHYDKLGRQLSADGVTMESLCEKEFAKD